jgi:hypothetical protein
MHFLVGLTFLLSIPQRNSSVNQLCIKRDIWLHPNRSGVSRICQPFLAPSHHHEVPIYSQGHKWVVLTVFLPSNVACFTIRIAEEERTGSLEFGGRRSVHAPPSESPGRPKTNQAKRITSHLHLHLGGRRSEERETARGSSILIWLLLRTLRCYANRTCVVLHIFHPSGDLRVGLHRSASRRNYL